ncbi:uncharacterized protein LOC110374277 [Helicoverpa armigera]|uniref:uncharacterized protein LOC110374277 n=1 Tax=Helicoverpa armigera TaxID=29058 RepID=UPI000B3943BE|nr:uncharacterized protein LOC110374277 [Helicoverpa armigera]XP_047041230.1 uncharacterized protein LOC124645464 [Helicoverpa zea]PZC79991.1 hypothetical protein B5X24_HaOG215460 [Helicoverpa armigera]
MKVTWVLLVVVGVVSADVGLGYHYNVPQTSYGVPSYQVGGNSGQYSSGQYNSGYSGSHSGHHGLSSGYQTGGVNAGSGSGYYQAGSNSGSQVVQQPYQTGYQTQYQSSSQYQSSAKKNYQQYYQVQQQPAQVFKHFYVHAAPEEPEVVKPRAPIVLPAPQKHYKIIFVKAPTESSAPNVIAPVQPQNEEKTIVYVLVKKPDEQPEVVLPKIEQKPPSKPEVYFIKYKNKEDSQAVINNIVKDYNQGQPLTLNSGSAESSYQSGLSGGVQYQAPIQHGSSSGYSSHGSDSQSFGVSSASANSGSSLSGSHITSSISSPVTVSSTASSIDYDGGVISTSQGVPHETYGVPKFRN